jgi:hypothetical protein
MSSEQDAPHPDGRPRTSRGRLRRSGQALVRVGAVLLAISLVVVLVGGLTTRSLLNNLQDNSAELLDGTATVTLAAGAERTLYVTGGLVAPGEDLPTPVEDIACTVAGPGGDVPVTHLSDQGKRVGLDNPLARFQVVGSFQADAAGEHTIECNGLGVVVAPEVSPADGLLRLGALMLGSLGTFAGVTLLLIGGILLLVVRHGNDDGDEDEDEDDGYAVGGGAHPPSEGAEEWWEDETRSPAAVRSVDGGRDADEPDATEDLAPDTEDDDFVELTDEELAALSEEQIAELVASGALVFVDEDGEVTQRDEPYDQDAQRDTYR